MKMIPIDSITVPADRQRPLDNEFVGGLADSIMRNGLLQAIVVEDGPQGPILRAGEHRLAAVRLLGALGEGYYHGSLAVPKGQIPCVSYSDLTPLQAFELELEENFRRNPLTWQEQAAAFAKLHALKAPAAPNKVEAVRETLAAFNQVAPEEQKTGIHVAHQRIIVGQNLDKPEVAKAKSEREAIKILSRMVRKEEDVERAAKVAIPNFFLGDCLDLLPTFPSNFFDALVTDPPYGIGIEQFSTQSSSEQEYDDTYESWAQLMVKLIPELARVMKADSHGYMFCDFSRFSELQFFLEPHFECYSRPLIWDRTPDGRLPAPEKWPRRVYECILYFRRGNRSLLEVRGDVLRYPADRDQTNYHGAKKPVDLYIDLLQRSTRPGDRFLDPFGGGGVALRAGQKCSREAWVIEKDPAYYSLSQTLLENFASK